MTHLGTYLDGRLEVDVGDITHFEGGAIVNAANSGLLGGGGVDGAIHRAGGPAILAECRALRAGALAAGLPAGEAVSTSAGELRAAQVIHTVGPIWEGGERGEPALLASCYRKCLGLAAAEGLDSVAFPAISTGVYGYPREAAARVAYAAIAAFMRDNEHPRSVSLIFFTMGDAHAFLEAAQPR